MNRNLTPIVLAERIKGNTLAQPNDISHWLVFLAYLAYLRAMRPRPPAGVIATSWHSPKVASTSASHWRSAG